MLDQSEMSEAGSSSVNTGAMDSNGGGPPRAVEDGIAKDGAVSPGGGTLITGTLVVKDSAASKLDQSEMIEAGSSAVNTDEIDASGGKPVSTFVGIRKDGACKLVGSTDMVDRVLESPSLDAVIIVALLAAEDDALKDGSPAPYDGIMYDGLATEIGRASCRERVF